MGRRSGKTFLSFFFFGFACLKKKKKNSSQQLSAGKISSHSRGSGGFFFSFSGGGGGCSSIHFFSFENDLGDEEGLYHITHDGMDALDLNQLVCGIRQAGPSRLAGVFAWN